MTDIMTLHSPQDWKLYRLGQLFRERKEKGSDKDFSALSVTMKGIVPQLESAAKSDDGDNRKVVRVGDYAINSRSDRKGSGGISDYEGSVSLISIVLEPNGIERRFAHHLLRSPAFQEEFYRWGHGIVADLWTTRFTDMKNIRLRLPDLATQRRIADFLDRETARLDLLIEKKQRLVALLGEKWTGIVERTISNDGPETKLGYHIDILSGFAFPSSDFSNKETDIRLLRGANVSPGSIRWEDVVYWPTHRGGEVSRFLLCEGDIVLGMDRPWISAGIRVARLKKPDVPSLLLQRVCQITPRNSLDKNFLELLLTSRRFLGYFEPILTGVSVPHISPDQVRSFSFPYISIERQRELNQRAMTSRQKINFSKDSINSSITRLKEYRSALITAAVTGQIDVATYSKTGGTDRRSDAIQEEMGA